MFNVTIQGEIFSAGEGELLSYVLRRNGKHVEHPCAGKGLCKKCLVIVNGQKELSCLYRINSDVEVLLPEKGNVLSATGAYETNRVTDNLSFILDIGTTTLALALFSLDEKQIVRVVTRTNPQRTFGADVISRIEYCRENGSEELQSVLINEINDMMKDFGPLSVRKLYVCANTTMLHLFFGDDCSSMGTAPYTPVFLSGRKESAGDIGLLFVDEVESLPSVSSFVGSDIVAGLNYISLPSTGKFNLFVDLGTNAEIVLFSGTAFLCASAAAGPCFEGVNISCGMSAINGAVCEYGPPKIKTVGNVPAKGICATGLIDIIATLLQNGTIDSSGYMQCGRFDISDDVYLNQADVREFQLAKSAVRSGIETLLKIKGISYDEIETLFIAGGMSYSLNTANAVSTGLIPSQMLNKTVPVNNASLLGLAGYVAGSNDLDEIVKKAHYVDLSSNPWFNSLFIDNMSF